MGALGFLLTRSARNRVVSVVTRLRSPRYAMVVLAGVGYLALILARPAHSSLGRRPLDPAGMVVTLAPLALAGLVAWWWLRGGFQSALAFTPAEVDLLFPAPLRRRTLIALKMLRGQPGLVVTATFFLLVFNGTLRLYWPLALLSLWLVLTILQWQQLGASLVRANVVEHTASARRGALPVILVVAAVIALLTGLAPELPALSTVTSMHDALGHLMRALQRPGPRVVLYPFRVLLALPLASDLAGWLPALPAVLVLLALHFVWVLRMDAAFEEAAAEAGRKRAELKANRKKGVAWQRRTATTVSRPWFKLEPTGRPGTAILWKNVLKFTRESRPGILIALLLALGATGIVLVSRAHSAQSAADACTGFLSAILAMTIVMMPITVRNDLRGDLRHMELLRTYPIGGRALMTGEIAGATLSLTVMQAALLVLTLAFAALGSLGHGHRGILAVAALLGLPIIVTLTAAQCTIQNAVAVFYPAWVHETGATGIEGMGQLMLTMIAAFFLLALLLLPALILGGAAFVGAGVLWGSLTGAVVAGVIVWGALCGEIAGALVWLGRAYDRLDPVEAGIIV
jgi:hypothetical protein